MVFNTFYIVSILEGYVHCAKLLQSCLTLCNPVGCSLPRRNTSFSIYICYKATYQQTQNYFSSEQGLRGIILSKLSFLSHLLHIVHPKKSIVFLSLYSNNIAKRIMENFSVNSILSHSLFLKVK